MSKKEEELMQRCIVYELYSNNELPRYYIVDRIRHDFESGGWYSVIDLKKTNEFKKYGTLEGAKKYALRLYERYHKELGDDMDIRIRDEYIEVNAFEKEIKKLKNKLALTEKALELACEELCENGKGVISWKIDDFKTKAKEMMKSDLE